MVSVKGYRSTVHELQTLTSCSKRQPRAQLLRGCINALRLQADTSNHSFSDLLHLLNTVLAVKLHLPNAVCPNALPDVAEQLFDLLKCAALSLHNEEPCNDNCYEVASTKNKKVSPVKAAKRKRGDCGWPVGLSRNPPY